MENTGKILLMKTQDKSIPINIMITYLLENEPKRFFHVYKKTEENTFEKMIPKFYLFENVENHTLDDFISFEDLGDIYEGASQKRVYPTDWRVNLALIKLMERFKQGSIEIKEIPIGTQFRVIEKGSYETLDIYNEEEWFILREQEDEIIEDAPFEPGVVTEQ